MISPRAHARRLFVYGLVGLSGTLVQYLLYVAGVGAGLDILVASVTGYVAGAVVNYGLNHRLTFRSGCSHAEAAPRFVVVALAGLALNLLILAIMARIYAFHYLLSQGAATLVCFFATYLLNSAWSFRRPPPDARKAAPS